MQSFFRVFLGVLVLSLVIGCSYNYGDITGLSSGKDYRENQPASHQLWGLWQFEIDPLDVNVGVATLRSGELHLNALSMLEPPPNENLTIEGKPEFSGGNVTVNIGLQHPAASVLFTGFDVKGILIGHGSVPLADLPALTFASENEIRLLNPDGYTRWWNPQEFPYNPTVPHQGYIDGLLGAPDSAVDFTATLNPYKYYCDYLTPEMGLEELPVENRGYFSAGQKNVRQYIIDFTPSGLIFNYAVDASWLPPTVPPPETKVPDDFPLNANQPEPYRIAVHDVSNSLVYNTTSGEASGSLSFQVDIYDWVAANQDLACGYSTHGELSGVCSFFPVGGGEGYSTYQIDTGPENMTSADDILLWIAAECQTPSGYNGILPFETQGTFFPYIVTVQEES
jgi:hypothetical protein